MAIPIPELARHEGSWVVVDKRDGSGVAEVFSRKNIGLIAERAKPEVVEIVTIGEWLARVNEAAKSAAR